MLQILRVYQLGSFLSRELETAVLGKFILHIRVELLTCTQILITCSRACINLESLASPDSADQIWTTVGVSQLGLDGDE